MRARAVGKIFQSMLTDVSFALQETVNKYKLKINDGNKEVEENLEIDTEKQTEIYRIPKTDSRNGGEVDIVYDFKKVKGGGGKRRGLGPRNDVLTTCKAVQNPYWPAVFLNGKPRFFSARKKKVQSRRNPPRSCLQLNIRGYSKFCTS